MKRKSPTSKKKNQVIEGSAELNIMPFIDVFSVLTTFLLMSAVFLSVGIIKVQVPFLSTNKDISDKPTRTLSINVDVRLTGVEILAEYSLPPKDPFKNTFPLTDAGLEDLHSELVRLRQKDEKTDMVTIFTDDDVTYQDITKVLDVVKYRKSTDPEFVEQPDVFEDTEEKTNRMKKNIYLYPKIVLGSVFL